MEDRVYSTITENDLIVKGDKVLLGLSGGPDSMALLYILSNLKKRIEFNLLAAHVNHGIRGEDADKDEEYVIEQCKKLDIPVYTKKVNMNEYAKKHKLSSEEAGREIRYSFFKEILAKEKANKIAVAHNRNDQAETLLMRFIRGTGIDGLRGMEYKNNTIIRPLLDISRSEIEEYCSSKKINPRIDKTNLEAIYGRNKVRLELIPYIERHFNSGVIDTLARTARIMQEEVDFLDKCTGNTLKEILISECEGCIIISNDKFTLLHPALKSRILRKGVEKISGHLKDITEKNIRDALLLSSNGDTGKEIHIGNNMRIRISYNDLIIEKLKSEKYDQHTKHKLAINDSTYIEALNMNLYLQVVDRHSLNLKSKDRFIKHFDYDRIKGDLFLRTRSPGDRFTPFGMKGNKKIKDFFIDEKIPRDKRDTIPLMVDDEEILWVVGYRISDKYKVSENTRRVLVAKVDMDYRK